MTDQFALSTPVFVGPLARRADLCSSLSRAQQYTHGTTNNEISPRSMPPTAGRAMGRATSLPRPLEARIGQRARIVVKVVIRQGRIRRLPGEG